MPTGTYSTPTKQPLHAPPIQEALTLSRKVDEFEPLVHGLRLGRRLDRRAQRRQRRALQRTPYLRRDGGSRGGGVVGGGGSWAGAYTRPLLSST